MKKIRIGTRGSRLALEQARLAEGEIHRLHPSAETELVVLQTKGDRILDRPFGQIGDKGLFVTEFEQALLDGTIDAAVHSAKDLPAETAKGLCICAALPRADVRDVLVVAKTLEGCANGRIFRMGTGSLRRKVQSEALWPDVRCEQIRGNVETRLKKLADGLYDGLILAKAGLDRLGISEATRPEFDFYTLNPAAVLPAACQGIIVVQAAAGSDTAALFSEASDAAAFLSFEVEREVLACLQADCSEPAAAWCREEDGHLRLDVMYGRSHASLTCPVTRKDGLFMAAAAAKQVKQE